MFLLLKSVMASPTKLSGYRFLFALFAVLLGCSCSVADSGVLNEEATCPKNESSCLEDPEGFEAISRLHALIDDDQNGGLDRFESEEFFREDLKHDNVGASLHNYDDFITVLDLWKYWFKSEAYNWTVSDVILWLNNYVELPQYAATFQENSISGRSIPKFATNIQSHAQLLGIKNAVHKQKLSIKSTDLVLFGPPKTPHNFKKDVAVIFSLLVGLGGCYFAYRQHKISHLQMQKVMKDLTSLQNAEDALAQVQNELEKAQKEQKIIANDKQKLERHLKDEIRLAKAEAEMLKQQRGGGGGCIDSNSELKVLEDELMKVKLSLYEAERRLEENQYVPLFELQIWLQLTYEIEKKYFDAKKEAAQKQLLAAKQMWEKIRKQKSKFLGSFRVAHTTSLDETDQQIMNVRTALDGVKMDLQERTNRWHEIEKLCHFNISTNPGIDYLTNVVKSDKLQSFSRYGCLSADDLSESGRLKKLSSDGTKLGSSTDSLGNISKDASLESSGVIFELGVADMHTSEPYLMVRNSMSKSKSMGDCIKLHSDNEAGRGSTHLLNEQTSSKLPGAVTETQTSASRENGNSSDSSLTFTEDSAKKKKSKLLNFIKNKKHE